ncbi:MAG TPA: POTRA domain-containing protein [Bacteroidales bacterium]|nr:POTRA domain-containing protein [Bacteroidales bacterium]
MNKAFLFLALLLIAVDGWTAPASIPDTTRRFTIGKITITGNKITRPSVILRELTFREDSVLAASVLAADIQKSRENLFNTSLFNTVDIDTAAVPGSPGVLEVTIRVIERWYFWPIPYLEFPNRNINAWLRDPLFKRLTYGANISFFNSRGRNETLTLLLHFGYNRKYGFTYTVPYVNARKTWGIGFGADAALNHALQVSVGDNHNKYLETGSHLLQQHYSAYAEVTHRPAWYLYHTLNVSYHNYVFDDTLRSVTGFFAGDSSLYQQFVTLSYKIKLDKRDVRFYPLKGYYADLILTKPGIGGGYHDLFSAQANLRGYWNPFSRWYLAAAVTVRLSSPEVQPFFLQESHGTGRDYVRGYDDCIIPGHHYLIARTNVRYALLPERIIRIPAGSPKFSVAPCALYLNLFCDGGYVWNDDPVQSSENSLCNTFLLGYGTGLDFTTYYNVVIGVSGTMNIQGKPRAFIHFIAPI